ncbi:hypothetical protein JCM8097_009343 [Rhodosporidiobolus ruineniae]
MSTGDSSLSFPPLASLAAAAHANLEQQQQQQQQQQQDSHAALPSLAQLPILSAAQMASQPFASMGALASTSGGAQFGAGGGGGGESGEDGSNGGKKGQGQKRKSSMGPAGGEGDGADGAKSKKPKIPRACDVCRRKKIRCNPIPDRKPMLCTYCDKHKLDCTWFLPISETRFKKQREKEEAEKQSASAAAAAVNLPTAATSATLAREARGEDGPSPLSRSVATPSHHLPLGLGGERGAASSPDSPASAAPRKEPRIVGYTSISHLMHSTSTFPTERMIPVDFKYSQQLSVDERGDGFIRVISTGDAHAGEDPVAIQGIEHSDAEKLLNYFFTTHSVHFPIVSKADFLGQERPTPLLFNAICAVSALSHHVAPSILRTIKATIRSHLRDEDMLDNSTIPNIQALLIYAFCMEAEKGTAASKTWNILGLAIRMAQDLGLHRKLGSERKDQSEGDHTELRRRVWGGCLIADRWMSAIYGQPMMIDLADCDTMLPSVFDIRPNSDFDAERRPYLFNSALISLSILLGRIIKAVYSPTGIMLLSEKDAKGLVNDLAAWQSGLPEELRFHGPQKSTPEQGFLKLLYIPVRFLITRPFMRLSFQLPERFASVSVGTQQWSFVETEAREAIEWVDKNESCLEGWFAGTYAFFICSLIQYHSHIRRRDNASLSTLRLARDCLKRLVVPEGECHVRAKIAEVVHLLYHTAVSVSRWAPEAAEGLSPASSGTTAVTTLNPTVGVRQREQDWHLRFKRDGGYFVTDRRLHDPTGLIRSSQSPQSSGGAATAAAGGQGSPYSSSLRSTHLAADPNGKDGEGKGKEGGEGEEGEEGGNKLPEVPPQPPTFPLPPVTSSGASTSPTLPTPASVPGANSLTSFLPLGLSTPSSSIPFSAPAPNPPPDLSFAFPDSTLENLSFNPVLNFAASASASGTATPVGGVSGAGGLGGLGGLGTSFGGGLGLGGGGAGAGAVGGASFLGGGEGSFDPFGFATDGTPSMLPDSLFDWNSWQSFADSIGVSGTAPTNSDGKTPGSTDGAAF